MDRKLRDFFIKEEKSIDIPEFKYKESRLETIGSDLAFYSIIIFMIFSLNFASLSSMITEKSGENLEKNKQKIYSVIKESTIYFYKKEEL